MSKLKFKKNVPVDDDGIGTDDFWYDCTRGGYIKPEKLLEEEDAKRVKEAIALVRQFEDEAEELGVIYYM